MRSANFSFNKTDVCVKNFSLAFCSLFCIMFYNFLSVKLNNICLTWLVNLT